MDRRELWTIGHSNHPLERFLQLLAQHQIAALVDIRRFPGSRTFPQFNQDSLAEALDGAGIEYYWIESLGGRRAASKSDSPSINTGLHNASFRHYADYMQTAPFREGIDELLSIAAAKRTAYMCSESVFWRCHRRLVSDFLLAAGHSVHHIFPSGEVRPHTLTAGAVVRADGVTYPGQRMLFEP